MKPLIIAYFLFVGLNFLMGSIEDAGATSPGQLEVRMEDVGSLISGPQYAVESGSGGNFLTAINSFVGGVVSYLTYPKRIFDNIIKWLTWDYEPLNGSYIYLKFFLLWPLSITIIFTTLMPLFSRVV